MEILARVIIFLLAVEVFDRGDVFFFLFKNNIDTYYMRIMATTLFLSFAAPKISLVVLILFIALALISRLLILGILAEGELVDLFFPESLSFFFAGLYPRKYLTSVFEISEDSYNNGFAFALIVFLTVLSQKSSSWSWVSN